jgi:hypothetical protein
MIHPVQAVIELSLATKRIADLEQTASEAAGEM